MKKTVFVALAATMFLTNSCFIKDNTVVVLPDPDTKEQAVSIDFNQGQTLQMELPDREVPSKPSTAKPGNPVKLDIVGIDLSESSRYILYVNEIETKAITKAKLVWLGSYKFSNGRYVLEGFGDIVINESKSVTVFPASTKAEGGEITIPASIVAIPAPTTRPAANLCRSWKITSMFIKVEGGKNKMSASRDFQGCNIYDVAKFIKDKGANISASELDKLVGYEVDELLFEGNNKVVLTFTGEDPYFGTWTMIGNDFTWTLDNSETEVLTKVNGTVDWNKSTITLSVKVTSGEETYTGSAQLSVVQSR